MNINNMRRSREWVRKHIYSFRRSDKVLKDLLSLVGEEWSLKEIKGWTDEEA
jgi:hypothetical protein